MPDKTRVHLFISGLVQGVFFRANTAQKAEQLGLNGWVRNLPDGKVEAVFEGEKEKIDKIIEWVKEGPPLAKIDDVKIQEEKYKNEFNNFKIRY